MKPAFAPAFAPRRPARRSTVASGGHGSRRQWRSSRPAAPRPAKARVHAGPKPQAKPRQATEANEVTDGVLVTPQRAKEHTDVNARQVGDEARKFIDELVAAFAFTGTTELIEDGDDLEVRVHGENLGLLVGPRGTTLQAVQDLARVASQRRLGDHDTRLARRHRRLPPAAQGSPRSLRDADGRRGQAVGCCPRAGADVVGGSQDRSRRVERGRRNRHSFRRRRSVPACGHHAGQ